MSQKKEPQPVAGGFNEEAPGSGGLLREIPRYENPTRFEKNTSPLLPPEHGGEGPPILHLVFLWGPRPRRDYLPFHFVSD